VIQGAALLFAIILIFVLVSGLVILWRRGPDELDAWGDFVARVLRGDRRSIDRQASTDIEKRK
jgi:uncharacterized iron-regulated membrane protein